MVVYLIQEVPGLGLIVSNLFLGIRGTLVLL